MKLELDAFPTKYTTMQARFIYVIFSRYESFSQLAKIFGVTRQYIHNLLTAGELPLDYALIMAEKWDCCIGLFNYYTFCLALQGKCWPYLLLLDEYSALFTPRELEYVTKGKEMLSSKTILNRVRKKVLKND